MNRLRSAALVLALAACHADGPAPPSNQSTVQPIANDDEFNARNHAFVASMIALVKADGDDCAKTDRDVAALTKSPESLALDAYKAAHPAGTIKSRAGEWDDLDIGAIDAVDKKCRHADAGTP